MATAPSSIVDPRNPLAWVRQQFRASEVWFVGLAIVVGSLAGAATVALGAIARTLQHVLFALVPATRLSGVPALSIAQLLVLPVGGAVLAAFSYAVRAGRRPLVDAVEANALHGGRMTVPDSLVVAAQTLISNGFGASAMIKASHVILAVA